MCRRGVAQGLWCRGDLSRLVRRHWLGLSCVGGGQQFTMGAGADQSWLLRDLTVLGVLWAVAGRKRSNKLTRALIVIPTDVPVSARNLKRICKRAVGPGPQRRASAWQRRLLLHGQHSASSAPEALQPAMCRMRIWTRCFAPPLSAWRRRCSACCMQRPLQV